MGLPDGYELFATKTFGGCWSTWQPLVKKALGRNPTPDSVLGLGGQLRDIFRSTGFAGRDQTSLSGGGAAWEALICYYLNLCLIGSNAIAIKKRTHVPLGIQDTLTVSYRNVGANSESDIVCVTFPEDPRLTTVPLEEKETSWSRLNFVAYDRLKELYVTVVQCKTNWNDNAQIPMLWDMVYHGSAFKDARVTLGANNMHLSDLRHFSYAFMTVPTNKLDDYSPNSLAVKRVSELSGGNYWGLETKKGIAKSPREIFSRAMIGKAEGRGILQNLKENLPDLQSQFGFFRL